ncbi:MAG: hypothetical protein EA406_13945, partial [Rhodospirillales bacterium]
MTLDEPATPCGRKYVPLVCLALRDISLVMAKPKPSMDLDGWRESRLDRFAALAMTEQRARDDALTRVMARRSRSHPWTWMDRVSRDWI